MSSSHQQGVSVNLPAALLEQMQEQLGGFLTADAAGIIERIPSHITGETTSQLSISMVRASPDITEGFTVIEHQLPTVVGQPVDLQMVIPMIGISTTGGVTTHVWANQNLVGSMTARVTTGAQSGSGMVVPASFVADSTTTTILVKVGANSGSATITLNAFWADNLKPYLLVKRYGMAALISGIPSGEPSTPPDTPQATTALASRLKTIAIAGDSLTGNNSAPSSREKFKDIGYMTWAQALSGQRLYYDKLWNFGVGGDNTGHLLDRLDEVLAANTDYILIPIGHNDVTHPLTVEQTCANLEAIWDRCYAAGKFVIASMLCPRSTTTTWTESHKVKSAYINNYIQQAKHRRKLFEVFNPLPAATDYSNRDGRSLEIMTYDGIHPGVYGAFTLGKYIAECIARLEPERVDLFDNDSNVYASNNPYGNLIPNGLFYGTSGTVGSGASGVVADDTGLTVAGSLPVVCSKSVNEYGMPTQVFTLSGTAGAGGGQVRLLMPAIAAPANVEVESLLRVKLNNTVGLAPIDLEIRVVNSASQSLYANTAKLTGTEPLAHMRMPDGSYELILRTPRLTTPNDATSIQLIFMFGAYADTPVSGSIEISQAWLRTVIPTP